MAHLLCLLFGHQKTLVPLSSNRYVCRRCGFDFGVEGPPVPAPRALAPTRLRPGSHSLSSSMKSGSVGRELHKGGAYGPLSLTRDEPSIWPYHTRACLVGGTTRVRCRDASGVHTALGGSAQAGILRPCFKTLATMA